MTWTNWTGDQRCDPAGRATPRSPEELAEVVGAATAEGTAVKVVGSGHSFTEAALTDGLQIALDGLSGILAVDGDHVTVGAGTTIARLNRELHARGRALANLGDIDRQTIAGAISTATHGTGARLPNLSAQVVGLELVTAAGERLRLDADHDPDAFAAARVGIGALGAISAVTLRTVPAFVLHRRDEVRDLDDVLATVDAEAEAHDHYEFFAFPYGGRACTIRRDRTEAPARGRSWLARRVGEPVGQAAIDGVFRLTRRFPGTIPTLCRVAAPLASEGEYVDHSPAVFVSDRRVRFTEMEYAVPRAAGPEVVRRILEWVQAERYPVAFPLECRVVAGDDAWLSPTYERDAFYVAVHQFVGMAWEPYFAAVEVIVAEHGGRPHWGKRHALDATTLRERYPRFDDFLAVRERLDPTGTFVNGYVRRCLGV